MTRILFTTIPISGHIRPGLPVARELTAAGHEVVWYSGSKFEQLISRTGARFVASGALSHADADVLQSMDSGTSGLGGFKRIIRDLFVDPVPRYAADLAPLLDELRPEVIVADHCFLAGPMLARREGLKNVVYVVGPLAVTSVDTAPSGTGLLPSSSPLGRLRNRCLQWLVANVVFRDVQRSLLRVSAEVGVPAVDAFLTDWTVRLADRYLVAAVPEFEYHRSDLPAAVEFIGPMLPVGVDDWTPPSWWPDIAYARERRRPVVLVTQGTAATDPTQLVLPAISALAGEDVLVVATTADADPDDVLPPAQRPANLRLTRFVPFTSLLPATDLVITNGGYGGVQMSLAFGVPLVTAGVSEDKMEVNRRVQWSGTGISLDTSRPSAARIRRAALKVLGEPGFHARARELAFVYARYPGARRAAQAILETAGATAPSHPDV